MGGGKRFNLRVCVCVQARGGPEGEAGLPAEQRSGYGGHRGSISGNWDLDLSRRWAFHQLSHPIHPFWVFFNG